MFSNVKEFKRDLQLYKAETPPKMQDIGAIV